MTAADPITDACRRLIALMDDPDHQPGDEDKPLTDPVYAQQAASEAAGHRRRTEALWRAWGWLSA